jgi:hypothetical protein
MLLSAASCCLRFPRVAAQAWSSRGISSTAAARAAPGAAGKAAAAASGAAGGGGGGNTRTEAGLQDLYMRALEPRAAPLVRPSAAELERRRALAVAYTQHKWRRRMVLDRDLSRKLALRWAAFHCLPTPERKQEALRIFPHVPLHRRMPSATPPLHGFAGRPQAAAAAAAAAASPAAPGDAAGAGKPAPQPAPLSPGARRGSARRGTRALSLLDEDDGAAAGKT